eukprot:TRINITY_DN49_c0_g1_i1.p1 TRINITY_DN49_c0_g1~~TRINITY_DN49_c0_g1_i1.p1  ORF type:complete len:501 (+),score=132.94 TRINITY_DN49_c0_g1_i1:57-1559(+)
MRARSLFLLPKRSTTPSRRVLTHQSLPSSIKNFTYAVRGVLLDRAEDLERQLASGKHDLPFDHIVYCNIGNPQQLGQKGLTWIAQVLSLLVNPAMLDHPKVSEIYPADTIERAKHYLKACTSTGSYSESKGVAAVREEVAAFIRARDGFADDASYCDPANIYLSNGASPAIQACLSLIIRSEADGIMISIPQYPLYSATIPCQGGTAVPYYLDEASGWGLNVAELRRSVAEARGKGVNPRAIVVINPGNPTGSCLSEKNIEEIIQFAKDEGLVILADEVYQVNIYTEKKPFVSFKKVLTKMGEAYKDVELLSFHSTSKGVIGECGKRGGYVEMTNILPEVHQQYLKLATLNLCPNLIGQLTMGLLVNPPKVGDPSYEVYAKEHDQILQSMKRRSELVTSTLNKVEGVSCLPAEGSMYAFPNITLPPKAVEEAKKQGKPADTLYCLDLLSETGLCVVPGSGFGQVDGTWHFRTTILPQEEELKEVLSKFEKFHLKFLEKYN